MHAPEGEPDVEFPKLTDSQHTWSVDPSRHAIRQAVDARRDSVFRDFFTRLAALP